MLHAGGSGVTRHGITKTRSAGYTPLSNPLFRIWWDATSAGTVLSASDVPATNGVQAKTWQDGSGNGNHAVNATSDQQPRLVTNAIGGLPALEFYWNSVFTFLSASDSPTLNYTTFHCFAVIRRLIDFGTTETICGKYNTVGNQREWRLCVNGSNEKAFAPTSSDGINDDVFGGTDSNNVNTNYLDEVWYDGTNHRVSINNGTPTVTALASVFNGTSDFFIGTRNNAAEPFGGYIGEIRFFAGTLSALERYQNQQDLSKKWGVTLS